MSTDTTTDGHNARAHRPWALWLLTPLMAVGSAIGVYMARHHEVELYGGEAYQGEHLVGCVESETVSCDIVNTSPWSEVFGVPTFAWAVPTYLLLLVLAVLAARGQHKHKPTILLIGLATVGFSGWLYYVSIVELGKVCLWCMRLYGINAAIPVLALVSGITRDDLPSVRELGLAAAVFAGLTAVTVAVQTGFRASLFEGEVVNEQLAAVEEVALELSAADPDGDAPAYDLEVRTEDKNDAQLVVHPDDAWKGNPNAKVAIIEFADFECGYCKRAGFQLRRLYEAYKDDVFFVYKHFPLDPACNPGVKNKKHRYACRAHQAAVCAQAQGFFWTYHDLLYKNQHKLRAENLLAYAEATGLDMGEFQACVGSRESMRKVVQNAEDGKRIDAHGTPRIWIDGRLYRAGTSAEQMALAIEAALGRKGADAVERARAMNLSAPTVVPIPADVPDMQRITMGDLDFFIDTFESGIDAGKATAGKRVVPATRMSWFAAHDACEAAGKRLCSEREWVATCQSAVPVDDDGNGMYADDMIEGNSYPYGDFHTRNMCWEDKEGGDTPWRPVYTGEMPGCVTPSGVYDLTGNVEEWVGATENEAALLGGAFDTRDDHARCYRRNDTYGAGYANARTGFRCCRDAD